MGKAAGFGPPLLMPQGSVEGRIDTSVVTFTTEVSLLPVDTAEPSITMSTDELQQLPQVGADWSKVTAKAWELPGRLNWVGPSRRFGPESPEEKGIRSRPYA